MILPRDGAGLPPWRRHVSTWLMGTLRLGVAWFIVGRVLEALLAKNGGAIGEVMPVSIRYLTVAALVVGGLLFAWSRTVIVGFVLLLLGLLTFETYWKMLVPEGGTLTWSVAVLAVLAFGEWLVRRVQKKLYAQPAGSAAGTLQDRDAGEPPASP